MVTARKARKAGRDPEAFLPEHGWTKTVGGGGCMAWQKGNTNDGGFMMLTDGDGADLPKAGGDALLGFYDKDGSSTGSYLRFPLSDMLYERITIG